MPPSDAIIEKLDSFDPAERDAAVRTLARETRFPPAGGLFNLHCHSFYSYNAHGWSPSRIAYECRMRGLYAAGLCDFDVLDGLEEFFRAGDLFGIRTMVHLETRAFLPELADRDINSPGEHGVAYIMGCGFTGVPGPDTDAGRTLAGLRAGAQARNRALIGRINAALPEIAIDEAGDLLPMTPGGAPTERHIVRAYRLRAEKAFPDAAARARFWAQPLKMPPAAFTELERDVPKCEDALRALLAKRGGIGYRPPDTSSFPTAERFVRWARECGAIPTVAWLDGTSEGEADAGELLDRMTALGCAAVNIIPDRNIRGKTPEQAALKQRRLAEMIAAAEKRGLPVVIGTEMNKTGLPFADDLSRPELAPYRGVFTAGADILTGHTLLGRRAGIPYLGETAASFFPDVKERNRFFAAVGAGRRFPKS